MTVQQIIETLTDRGGRLDFDNGQLIMTVPVKNLDADLLTVIRRHHDDMVQAITTVVVDRVAQRNLKTGNLDVWQVWRRLDGGATWMCLIETIPPRGSGR